MDTKNFQEDEKVCARLCVELAKDNEVMAAAYSSSSPLGIEMAKDVTKSSFNKGWVLPFATTPLPDEEDSEKHPDLVAPNFKGAKSLYELACNAKTNSCKELNIDQLFAIAHALINPLKELHKHGIEHGHVNMHSVLAWSPTEAPSGQAVVASSASSNKDEAPLEIMAAGTKLLLKDIHHGRFTADSPALYRTDAAGIVLTLYRFGFDHFKILSDMDLEEKGYLADVDMYLAYFSPVGLLNRGFWGLDYFDEMERSAKSMWKFVTMGCLPGGKHTFDQLVAYLEDDAELPDEDVQQLFDYAKQLQAGKNRNWFDTYVKTIAQHDQGQAEKISQKRSSNLYYVLYTQHQNLDKAIKAALEAVFNFKFIFRPLHLRCPVQKVPVSGDVNRKWVKFMSVLKSKYPKQLKCINVVTDDIKSALSRLSPVTENDGEWTINKSCRLGQRGCHSSGKDVGPPGDR
eukprot:GHVS01022874.1.p1 GENE.GHVS01022874.1~~GHVS01022874.1.p1  ORF type:complete len:458 (-),score=49.11 GHVS01022874.1:195-1568(-)